MTERITVEIPQWAIGRHIRVFAGIEQLAYKKVIEGFPNVRYGETMVKVSRCSMCGVCCKNTGCPYLKHEVWDEKDVSVCDHAKLPKGRPWVCCIGSNSGKEWCTVRYEEAK